MSDSRSNERLRRPTQLAEPSTDQGAAFGGSHNHKVARRGGGSIMSEDKQRSLVTYNHITYLLYVLSYFTAGLLWIVPVVMNYARRHDADSTWLATHFDWQIKTFWYSLFLFGIGIVIITFALGGFGVSMLADSSNIAIGSVLLAALGLMVMGFTLIWNLYRIVRGWIALTDGRAVP